MPKLVIVASKPIRLDREVAAGETLAVIDTDHSIPTLFMMLQQGQATVMSEDAGAPAVAGDDPFLADLRAAGISVRAIALLASAGVTDRTKATKYLVKNGNTFEPIDGIGPTISRRLVQLLG